MCFATAALVAGVVGGGVTAYGQYEGGQATANAARYQAEVAKNNATIANQNADRAIAAGEEQAANQGRKNAAVMGKIKAGQAASGIDVNTGSAVDVQAGERSTGQLDAETLLNNAQLKAFGYRSQATGFEDQSQLETMTSKQAPIAGDIGAFGTVLGNAASLGLKWAQLGPSGTGGSTSGGDNHDEPYAA